MLSCGSTCYNSIMNELTCKVETRGRPRKNIDQKLPPISRKLFSEHCAVFYACCMVYVLQVFLKTKQEKRIGHSQGGFTIYQKMNAVYCFDSLDEDVKEWGYEDVLLDNRGLCDFIKTVNGCAPKFVFRELVTLIVQVHNFLRVQGVQTIQDLQANQHKLLNCSQNQLNRLFKYIRFTPAALKELKMEKWAVQVAKKIKQLWKPFLKVMSYTVFCVEKNIDKNKYLKPFFSDAEHPQETIIGQLNLQQIVEDKEQRPSPSQTNQGFTKIPKLSEEDLLQTNKKIELQHSPISQKAPVSNKRPITLITFPSNSKIEGGNSPVKLFQMQNHNLCDDQADKIISEHSQPAKKIKLQ